MLQVRILSILLHFGTFRFRYRTYQSSNSPEGVPNVGGYIFVLRQDLFTETHFNT